MQSIDTSGIKELDAILQQVLDESPEGRRELHSNMANMLEQELGSAISSSKLTDSSDRIRRYQVKHIGSGGGYAAIRPIGSKEGAENGSNGPGAITNYLNSGYRIRKPKGSKHYRPRINVPYVSGYHFYDDAGTVAESKAIQMAEDYATALVQKIGGG